MAGREPARTNRSPPTDDDPGAAQWRCRRPGSSRTATQPSRACLPYQAGWVSGPPRAASSVVAPRSPGIVARGFDPRVHFSSRQSEDHLPEAKLARVDAAALAGTKPVGKWRVPGRLPDPPHRFVPTVLKHATGHKAVSYTHLRAHETRHDLVCRLLLEKKK